MGEPVSGINPLEFYPRVRQFSIIIFMENIVYKDKSKGIVASAFWSPSIFNVRHAKNIYNDTYITGVNVVVYETTDSEQIFYYHKI